MIWFRAAHAGGRPRVRFPPAVAAAAAAAAPRSLFTQRFARLRTTAAAAAAPLRRAAPRRPYPGAAPLPAVVSPGFSAPRRCAGSLSSLDTTFLQGTNSTYIEEMHRAWLEDPSSVHVSWRAYFSNLKKGASPQQAYQVIPGAVTPGFAPHAVHDGAVPSEDVLGHLKVALLVRAYQVRGHHLANLDPLGINVPAGLPAELTVEHYGFTEKDLSREFTLGPGMLPGFTEMGVTKMTLQEILRNLRDIYCILSSCLFARGTGTGGSIGTEYCHIPDKQ
ncbi:MAG: hypothetical protein BJ554DRAFT_8208, partial [Olpidium bornovanus]